MTTPRIFTTLPSVPNLTEPLVRKGGTRPTDVTTGLGPLVDLIGTWNSPTSKPNGWNTMPLPQATAPNEFILKNFFYYEELTFSAIRGSVANRGGSYTQTAYTLFYEQRVFFGDGPSQNGLVHAENGSWLHLETGPQMQEAYGETDIPTPYVPDPIPPQS
ncbi:MAG: hypothetical protein IIB17_00260 [Chloroflexi bacterium]|nr:hypothetical protein [Chloroflexota bacterium]